MGNFGELRLGAARPRRACTSTTSIRSAPRAWATSRASTTAWQQCGHAEPCRQPDQHVLPGNLGGFYGSIDLAAGEGSNVAASPKAQAPAPAARRCKASALASARRVELWVNWATAHQRAAAVHHDRVGAAYDFGAAKLQLNLGETKYLDRKQSLTTIGLIVPIGKRPDYGGLHRRQGQRGSRSTGRRGRRQRLRWATFTTRPSARLSIRPTARSRTTARVSSL